MMERFRRKKLKAPVNDEGSQQIQRQRSIPNQAFDSSYMNEFPAACELDRSASRRISGSSIKNLLAEEMSKEIESKRQSPSIVARLMGVDVLPTQKPIHRQRKTSNERTIYEMAEIRGNPYEGRTFMKSSRESPKFKDVYEVSEERESVKAKSSEAEMNFIRQKFMDAKRLLADEKSQNSEEFRDTLDALDTNKELLIKFLQQPDSFYKKHLNDLQGASRMSNCSNVQPISETCENKNINLKSKKRPSLSNTRHRKEKLGSLSPNSCSPSSSSRSSKSSEFPLERKHETKIQPTRIVVLKPHIEKLQNAKKHVPSRKKLVEYQSTTSEGTRQLGGKSLPSNVEFSRPNVRESRKRAEAITRRMSRSLGKEPIDSPSIFQGYAGDESSYNVSGSDSGSELETMLSVRKSFHWSNRQNATSSYSRESSINREATMRLSKRWNVSQKNLDVDSAGQVSKLGEMLAKSDREMRRDKFDPKLVPHMSRNGVSDTGITDLDNSLGINFRDDCKDKYVRNASRPDFISNSSASCYSPESSRQSRKPNQVKKLILKKSVNGDRNKAINENVTIRLDSPMRNRRAENKEPQLPHHGGDRADIAEKHQYITKVGENIPPEEVSFVSKMHGVNDHDPRVMIEAKMGVEHVSKHFSRGPVDDISIKPTQSLLGIKNSSAPGSNDSEQQNEPSEEDLLSLQSPVPDTQSPLSSKEPDQPSPVSVLEGPLTEDISSGSECFEKVSADLQELRLQLKLLRMESRGDENNLALTEINDKQESFSEIDENAMLEYASWQTSYINDVIIESGFDSTDPNMIIAIWHSLQCPISPWVFDKLENKYSKDKSSSKSDRKLFFDRINCGLVEIFQWLVDPYPWVENGKSKFCLEWRESGVRNELEKWLANEERYTCEKVLDKEMEWFDFGDEIDVIGREVEILVVNDLIDELVNLYAF